MQICDQFIRIMSRSNRWPVVRQRWWHFQNIPRLLLWVNKAAIILRKPFFEILWCHWRVVRIDFVLSLWISPFIFLTNRAVSLHFGRKFALKIIFMIIDLARVLSVVLPIFVIANNISRRLKGLMLLKGWVYFEGKWYFRDFAWLLTCLMLSIVIFNFCMTAVLYLSFMFFIVQLFQLFLVKCTHQSILKIVSLKRKLFHVWLVF